MNKKAKRMATSDLPSSAKKQDFVYLTDLDKLKMYERIICMTLVLLLASYIISGLSVFFGLMLVANCFTLTIIAQYKFIIWSGRKK